MLSQTRDVFLMICNKPLEGLIDNNIISLYNRGSNIKRTGMERGWLFRRLKAPVLDIRFIKARPVIYGPAQRCSGQQNG